MIKTEAGEKMKEENPVDGIKTIDGQELLRQELEKEGKKFGMPETPEMNMGGLMGDGMGVIIGIEAESGNEIPAGSKPEEVADDIPAMLSEGEYVVPADVVRWHGVKTFEGLRCEAKMGMGLMAQDGRIAEVDDDYEHGHDSPDYDIEEKDKPKMQKAKYEVVEAAEGVSIQDGTENISAVDVATTPTLQAPWRDLRSSYYGYKTVYNPETKRYEFKAVDPETDEFVAEEEFEPAKATRFTPRKVIAQEVYGTEGLTDEEVDELDQEEAAGEEEETTTEEIPTCPAGTVYDENLKACVPEMGTDQPDQSVPTGMDQFASYGVARALGPDETYAGKPEDALTRATTPTVTAPGKGGFGVGAIIGSAIKGAQRFADAVGAHRAILQRTEDIRDTALGVTKGEKTAADLPDLKNLTYNDITKSYIASSTYAKPTSIELNKAGKPYVADWEWDSYKGDPLATDDNGNFTMSDEDFDTWVDDFDDEVFGNLPTTTGKGRVQQEKVFEEERKRIAAEQKAAAERAARAAAIAERQREIAELNRIQAERDAANQASRTEAQRQMDERSRTISEQIASGEGGGPSEGGAETGAAEAAAGSDYSSDPTGYSGSFSKGGYVTKRNKPKVATMQYSKGSK